MGGNLNLSVGCRVAPFSLEASRKHLAAQGWQPAEIPPLANAALHAAFTKGSRYLTIDANSSQRLWALSMLNLRQK